MRIESEPPHRLEEPDDEKAQEERRLEGIARNLGLKERMNNPTVKEYVKTLYLLEQVQQRTLNNPSRAQWGSNAELAKAKEQSDTPNEGKYRKEAEPKPSIEDRYTVARGMIATALEYMKHGFSPDEQFDHEYVLNHYLGYALERMGWEVKPKTYDIQEEPEKAKKREHILFPPEITLAKQPIEFPEYRPQHDQQDKN